MKKRIIIIVLVSFNLFLLNNLYASTIVASCNEYISSKGFPENPKTVLEFKYMNIALGEIKEDSPNCLPNSSEQSPLRFETIFSEKTIDNLISLYSSYQVIQMALLDLKTEISSISYWYITKEDKFAAERANLYLLEFYVMLKSLELLNQNTENKAVDTQQLEYIKEFVFKNLKVVESYVSYDKFFGYLTEKQHISIRSRFTVYISRLKSVSVLRQDTEYQNRLEAVIKDLN